HSSHRAHRFLPAASLRFGQFCVGHKKELPAFRRSITLSASHSIESRPEGGAMKAKKPKRKGAIKPAKARAGFRTVVTATLSVRNWAKAMDFYKAAFGAKELYRVPGGGVGQLSVDGAEFWVAEESPKHLNFSPESIGGCSVRMLLMVEDPD